MSLPSNFPGEKRFFVVCGGDQKDPDQMKLSLMKVYCPTSDPETTNVEKLAFVSAENPANQPALEQCCGPPEAGTVVCGTRNLGDPTSCTIQGMPMSQYFDAQNVEGNSGLYTILMQLANDPSRSGKRIKPQVIERIVNGVLVREIQEKGQDWMHALTKGLAVHAAWKPMTGQLLNEVKNIDTALQNFANIPTLGALLQLPGSIMNIASLFNSLSIQQKKQATKNMSPLLIEGLNNMMLLMGNSEGGTQYVSSNRINPAVFTRNMIDLLSQVDNISDLINTIERLQYDETLRGLEEYSQKANSGLVANTIVSTEILDYSILQLSDNVETSIHYFDDGYSLNVASNTYIVLAADPSSNTINVYPKIESTFSNTPVFVYLPVIEYDTQGPYGSMTMTMDMYGNVSPNKNSAQKIQQAMQAIQSLMSSAEAGKKFLFGDASGIMSQLFNRIPNNIRATILTQIAQVAKQKLDAKHKKAKGSAYPFK